LVAETIRTSTCRGSLAPTGQNSARLERAQEERLERRRRLADLVEEERASVGELEETAPRLLRAGERPLHVAEELAAHQLGGSAARFCATNLAATTAAALVDLRGDELLAGARLPVRSTLASVPATAVTWPITFIMVGEVARRRGRDACAVRETASTSSRRRAFEAFRSVVSRRFSSSRRRSVVARRMTSRSWALSHRLLDVREQVTVVDGGGEVVVIAEAGEEDALRVPVRLVRLREQLGAVHRAHAHVAHEHVELP